ncbi:hypothetical protein BCL57_000277 [Agromyces flavus]|uniref:Uncharacterized protein n=1 Tax=Agromyces flavus TaxID=589382 RepID=A0A1H1WAZ0_9MICO|nr:hypothetical protein [Agromyces flavus]MCP2366135.1 hypothetical protein [Agromyces flavus]GGI44070.1 hypothetical protein GCM10010932_02770 [Agromyces flavus]SDS94498.1 hypothetical protein SAMN04489721_2206 [Agromyces flavus]
MDACAALAESIERLAALGYSDGRFLKELGRAAGVRRGPMWLFDAASGGRNRIRGRGFDRAVDDDTDGQARHFAGTIAVAARLGGRLTRWLVVQVLRDAPDSADGRLSDEAIEFVRLVRTGGLQQADAADWVRDRLCRAAAT